MALTEQVIMPGADYEDACDAIREKTGGTDLIKSGEMGGLIRGIEGENHDAEDAIISNTLEGAYFNDRVTNLTSYAFAFLTKCTHFQFQNVTSIGGWVFTSNSSNQRTELPKLKTIGNNQVFNNNKALKSVDVGFAAEIKAQTFLTCSALKVIILRTATIAALANINAFNSSSLASGGVGCTILVPRSLITEYPNATNWSTIYSYGNCTFLAVEDYTKDGTTSGEPDWDKIETELMT